MKDENTEFVDKQIKDLKKEYAKVLLNQSAYNEKPFTAGIEIIETKINNTIGKPVFGNTILVKVCTCVKLSNFETMECHGRFTPKMVISSEKRELFQEEGFHEKKHMVKPCMAKKTFTLFNENCMNSVNSL